MVKGLLENKVVVITGAGSGVGYESTLLFAEHGAKIAALDIDVPAAEKVAALVRERGGEAFAMRCDVAEKADVDAAVAKAVETFGRLDIMFNNAGVTAALGADFLDGLESDLLKLVRINVGGVLNGSRAAIRVFRQQGGGGVILNTASLAGLISYGSPVYSSTKGAVTTLTRALALQYAEEGIRVNAVCPAAMMTNFGVGVSTFEMTPEIIAYSASRFPIKRNIEASECAGAALFLASDLASGITGVNLPIDGGISAGVKM